MLVRRCPVMLSVEALGWRCYGYYRLFQGSERAAEYGIKGVRVCESDGVSVNSVSLERASAF